MSPLIVGTFLIRCEKNVARLYFYCKTGNRPRRRSVVTGEECRHPATQSMLSFDKMRDERAGALGLVVWNVCRSAETPKCVRFRGKSQVLSPDHFLIQPETFRSCLVDRAASIQPCIMGGVMRIEILHRTNIKSCKKLVR